MGAASRRGGSRAASPPRRHRHLCSSHNRAGGGAAVVTAAAVAWSVGALTPASADDVQQFNFTPRSFDGVGNNEANPEWGAAGTPQIRSLVGADYADAAFSPPGELRPTAREVLTDVFLPSPPALSTKSALFVAWGQLLTYDIALTSDNSSEPFDIPCNDAVGGGIDVWCPLGANSDPIPFFRSDASVSDDGGALPAPTRSPTNYATSFIDLDFVYGRSEEEAQEFRELEGGRMSLTDDELPLRSADGESWLIADQRTARFPVTFALHVVLLREHNRCCVEIAPAQGFEGDEDLYQACRGWTIAVFQHITENDFLIRLLGGNIQDLGIGASTTTSITTSFTTSSTEEVAAAGAAGAARDDARRRGVRRVQDEDEPGGEVGEQPPHERRRRVLWSLQDYDEDVNAAADVFTTTAGAAALESALPSTVRVVGEGYVSVPYDHTELAAAVGGDGLATFFENVEVADVLRGAVLSPVFAVDTHYPAAVSNGSPLFKLPVDAVQRGRDHGLPTYNEARLAFGLPAATSFLDVTAGNATTSTSSSATAAFDDEAVATLLSSAYGGDISDLDAITGALAETPLSSSGGVFGPLLHAAWEAQMYRTFQGDRFHHLHTRDIEDAALSTISDLVNRTTGAADLPLSAFAAAGVEVCGADCATAGAAEAALSDSYLISWKVLEDDMISISLSAKGIGDAGMLGFGLGGLTMSDAKDYVICEVISGDEAECIDRQPTGERSLPEPDTEGDPELGFESVTVEGGWTTVTFLKPTVPVGDQDYDLASDIADKTETAVIFSFREGAGVGQHPNANRGASTVNFATGDVENLCNENNFATLHGALMLIAWMVLAPWGIYYVRYRKGEQIDFIWQYEWWEMHEEIMIVASEAVLPLGITAIFATGGEHGSSHAHWGYYMIAAVVLQVLSGWLRVKGLGGKNANFSLFHRFNKFFHIYSGRFAYLAGVVQCYRGLELVSSDDKLIFSAGEGLDLKIGSFGFVYDFGFPAWFALIAVIFIALEARKQYRRFFNKGSAKFLGCVQIVNERHNNGEGGGIGGAQLERLVPRTEDLPIYSVAELNDKVLNGQSWVLVDGAILDVSEFAQRHPGGRTLILNALGTDVTQELLGEDLSVGHAMSFSPHAHSERAWTILRGLVVGYLEEDDEDASQEEGGGDGSNGDKEEAEAPVEDGDKEDGEERRPSGTEAAEKRKTTFRVAGQAVMFMASRGTGLAGDPLAAKAQRLNGIAAIPDNVALPVVEERQPDHSASAKPKPRRLPPKRSNSSSKKLLERFHVCPLLFREKMVAAAPALKSKSSAAARPVYRYIFLCPGQAQLLAQAITGVCYFNMRSQEQGQGVVQRSYNAYAVRVQDTNPFNQPQTPGGGIGLGGLSHGGDKGAGTLKVIPASQTNEGILCIEMRIRLYHDGAMSKILEKLAKDTDNPAVQLQGPFVIKKLVPPPAHRNVVMIAAGTGINPMVQQIRDYLNLPRGIGQSSRSRLALVWQATSEADLYGADEMTEMQAKSNGLLEVTVLLSGEHRKRNIPGAAFRKGAGRLLASAARGFVSPTPSPVGSVHVVPPGSAPKDGTAIEPIAVSRASLFASGQNNLEDSGHGEELGKGRVTLPEIIKGKETGAGEGEGAAAPAAAAPVAAPTLAPAPAQTPPPASTAGGGGGGGAEEGNGGTTSSFRSIFSNFGRDSSRSSIFPSSKHHKRAPSGVAGTLTRGKVTRAVLEDVFGPTLLAAVQAAFRKEKELSNTTRRQRAKMRNGVNARKAPGAPAATAAPEEGAGGAGDRDEDEDRKEEEEWEPAAEDEDEEDDDLAGELAGKDSLPGKLQVVVSGPSGFVFFVESILAEMGVLSSAIVLLD
eukprot:g2416.t2